MPGDNATVGLVSCRGGGGSGVSEDRGWTFDGGAIAAREKMNACAHGLLLKIRGFYAKFHVYYRTVPPQTRSLPVRSKTMLREERFDCVRVRTFGY